MSLHISEKRRWWRDTSPRVTAGSGGGGTIVYREENRIDSQTINQFGYGTVPHVYGLMGYEALEAAGVMQILQAARIWIFTDRV